VLRVWRVGEVDNCEANEDHPPGRLFRQRAGRLQAHHLQESHRKRTDYGAGHEETWACPGGAYQPSALPSPARRISPSLTVCSWIQDNADKIMDYDLDLISSSSTYCFPEDLALSVQQLWRDPIITKLLDEHSSEFYLMDSAPLCVSFAPCLTESPRANARSASSRKPTG
jgi:hypothetical protein